MKYVKFFNMNRSTAFIVLLLFVLGCGTKTTEKAVSGAGNIDHLKLTFVEISSELDSAWSTLEHDDNEKLFEMKRLLDEVSYTNVFDAEVHKQLEEQVELLKSIRYDRQSMADSDRIDKYDSATQYVMSKVISFAQDNPQFENYPLMKELINDIMEADHQVLFFRTSYDNAAREYNSFISDNEKIITEVSDGKLSIQPLFALE